MAKSHYIVVIGCGRLGAVLANRLSRQGHSVVVVDCHDAAFRALSQDFGGFQILGDAAELSVLQRAGIDKADAVCVTTGKDTLNLLVAQVARELFQVKTVLVRVFDSSRANIYQEFNIATIDSTRLAAEAFLQRLQS